jgi:hypothetical protein
MDENGCRRIGAVRLRTGRARRKQGVPFGRKHERAARLLRRRVASVEKDATRPEYKDPFLAEDARTTAKLKNICRGC